MMKIAKTGAALVAAGLMSSMALGAESTLITDAVEGYGVDGGWTNQPGGTFLSGVGGLAPVAGSKMFSAYNSGSVSRGTWKLFPGTFTNEALKVSYWIGELNLATMTNLPSNLESGLFADVNNDGLWQYTERIAPFAASNPVPVNAWAQWSDTYHIDAATKTASGSNVLGSAIGFYVRASDGAGKGFGFDALRIETTAIPVGELPQPVVWLDAEQGVGLVGGKVAAWTNLAATGSFNAVQATAAKRPALLYEAWPGHQVIHFDGVDDLLALENSVNNLNLVGEFTVFSVGRVTGGSFSGTGGFIGNFQTGTGYKNGWTLRTLSDGTYGFLVGNGGWNQVSGGSAALGEDFVMLNARYADDGDGTGTMELFSSLLETSSTAGTTPFALKPSSVNVSIGMFCGWNSLVFSQPVECDIAEIRIYDRALDDAERQAVWDELSAKYAVASHPAILVEDFQPTGYEVAAGTPIQITFSEAMDPASATNIIVGIGGLDGLPEGNAWTRAAGQWTASVSNTVLTFAPDAAFAPGALVMCEIPTTVVAAGGNPYRTDSRETFAFIVDNGVSYPVVATLVDPMAIVYHDNGDPHILPVKLHVPATPEPCPVMFWVHGGGWSGGDSGTWEKSAAGDAVMADYFSRKLGVAVVGVAWRSQSNSQGTFTKVTNDVSLAVRYVLDHAAAHGIDVSRMGLYGGSAGTPTSALVAQAMTNINCYIGFNGLYDFVNRTGTGSFGGGTSFGQNIPSYSANSAALHVRANPPDTLLLHGSADTTIEHQQSLWYAERIRAAGGDATAMIYRDEVHAFFNSGQPMHLPTLRASVQHLSRVFKLGYGTWAHVHGLAGGPAGNDDGDRLNNLYEYGLGGDPTNMADTGILPTFGLDGGLFEYRYPRRTAPDSGLLYSLELADDLVAGIWRSSGYVETGVGMINAEFEAVTNAVPMAGKTNAFIRLKIIAE